MRGDGLRESGGWGRAVCSAAQGAVLEPGMCALGLDSPVWLPGSGAGENHQVLFIRFPALSELAQGLWPLMPLVGSVVKAKAA